MNNLSSSSLARGRCLAIETGRILLRNQAGVRWLPFVAPLDAELQVGDVLEIRDGHARVLTPNRTPARTSREMERTLAPRRLRAMALRTRLENAIREFFVGQDFMETRTPTLVPCPGMEPHIRPFPVGRWGAVDENRSLFLPTSPEFAMKRLLVGGLEKIFQLSTAYRDEPVSITHNPEFTMLEWYRAYAGYEEIMTDTENLFAHIGMRLHGKPALTFQGREISVAPPWPRLQVRDLFQELAGVDLLHAATATDLARECARLGLPADLARESWDDLYFKIWLNRIEPELPTDRAVFVTRYPVSQAALAVVDEDADGSRWARRFEVYAGGLELGNAFEELTDPVEQRERFVRDMNYREEAYGPDFPACRLDEGFLEALAEGMPPSGGIAMGVDRIVMLFGDEPDLGFTRW